MCGIGVVLYHSRTAEAAGSATTGVPVHALQRRGPDAQGELVAALGFEPDSGHHHVPRQRAGHVDAQGESCVVLTCGVTNTPNHT